MGAAAMLKVCMIVHNYYHDDGRVRSYVESLSDAGHRVDVLCLKGKKRASVKDQAGLRIFSIPLSRFDKNYGNYFYEYGLAFALYSAWLLALFIKNRYHVIHVHNMPDFLVFTALIPKLFGAKIILDIHDPMPEFYASKYQSKRKGLGVQLMLLQERISAAFADQVITANSTFRNNLVKRGIRANKLTVINNIPDPKIFNRDNVPERKPVKNNHFRMIYPGTVAPRYGLDTAIRAMTFLVKKIDHPSLVIIGSQTKDKYVIKLNALAEKLGVSNSVHFIPTVPLEEIPSHIFQADVGIYLALPDPHMNIAIPAKVVEYAFMGLPIVATRLKVLEELLTDSAALLFEPGNCEQFADCILELYNNPLRRRELVRNADRILVSKHNWKHEQKAYFRLLNRLID
jgi:glycosyltransferase involved in cell wall biosynthesis